MRCRGQQEEVTRQRRKELPQSIPLRVLDFAAEIRGRHLMGLVAHHEVPAAVRRFELVLDILVARQLVEPSNDEDSFEKPIAGSGSLELVVGQNHEGQRKPPIELVLPLLSETSWA